ncbi:glutelin [Bradyrhizobium sp. LHD-71]|uniref:glutelin n=1 Tax=Bradyrhizobium sp. LHD-71 TaxID=3072141 RepID=UPI00280D18C9|nr:glutelin [Bradyrhizobium sp. LHD-71]MDQ8732148.1 glutelin [Bradyrhizobium sp. LHD-71]
MAAVQSRRACSSKEQKMPTNLSDIVCRRFHPTSRRLATADVDDLAPQGLANVQSKGVNMLRQVLLVALVSAAGAGAFIGQPAVAAGFTCPSTTAMDASKNAPPLADLFTGATDATADQRLNVLVTDLRKNGTSPSSIVNYLVGAYCPLVLADTSLSDAQKTTRVRRFARQVAGLAFVPSEQDELAVIVDLPLTPSLLDQIDKAAAKSGISRDIWIDRAISRQLASP